MSSSNLSLLSAIEHVAKPELWIEFTSLCPTEGERGARLAQVDKFKRDSLPSYLMVRKPGEEDFFDQQVRIRSICEQLVECFKRQVASGDIVVSGVPVGHGTREKIDAELAASLDIDPYNNAMYFGQSTRFEAVQCTISNTPEVQNADQISKILKFWNERYGTDNRAWPDNNRLEHAARDHFGDVTQDEFRAALSTLGRKRGRRRKIVNSSD